MSLKLVIDDENDSMKLPQRVAPRYPSIVKVLCLEFCVFAVIAIASTWPLALHLQTSLPLGTEHAATVPLFTSWSVWWNCDRLTHLYEGYWTAPIFGGSKDSFAFSEPMPLTAIGLPIYWLTNSPAATCNTLMLLALALNGWTAYRLFLRIYKCWQIAFVGGLMVELLPFVHHEIAVLQLVPVFGLIWTLNSVHHWLSRPSFLAAIAIGVSSGISYLLCSYYGLFLVILLALVAPVILWREAFRFKTWLMVIACAATFALVSYPVISSQLRVSEEREFKRSAKQVQRLSATLPDYLSPPWPPVWQRSVAVEPDRSRLFPMYPGNFNAALAALGILLGVRYRRSRRWTIFSVGILTAAVLCSLGPGVRLAGTIPFELLATWVPGLSSVRSIFRFGLFAQLMVVQLAVLCLATLLTYFRAATRERLMPKMRWLPNVAILLLGVVAALELCPLRQRLFELPAIDSDTAWIAWLSDHTETDAIIACLPFPKGKRDSDYQSTAISMYAATYHRRTLANGYSGFFPQPYFRLKAALATFPNDLSVMALTESEVDYCVVERTAAKDTSTINKARSIPITGLRLVFTDDESRISIYEVSPN